MSESSQKMTLRVLWAVVSVVAIAAALAFGANHGEGPRYHNGAPFSRLSGVRFAVSDFDGDRKPDLASVETTSLSSVNANYAIHFQFSGAAQALFQVVAPIGGVRVSALDVNGDNLTDLVVSSVFDERVVVIFVNHGQGHFSPTEPNSIGASTTESREFFHGLEWSVKDTYTVASLRYSFDGDGLGRGINSNRASADSVTTSLFLLPSGTNLNTSRGRSPPVIFHA